VAQTLVYGTNLNNNSFGVGSYGAVVNKYKSGNLVNAFKAALQASADAQIQGSPTAIYLIKTNSSTKAFSELYRSGLDSNGLGKYSGIADASFGALGNALAVNVSTSTTEVAPTTGAFAYVPNSNVSDTATVVVRVNGGAAESLLISANTAPSTLTDLETDTSSLNSLSGILATGGLNRGIETGISGTLTFTRVTATTATISASGGSWTVTPVAGDTLQIPSGSAIEGAGNVNVGWYIVTSANANTINVTAISTTGAIATASGAVASNDLDDFSPVTIQQIGGLSRNTLNGLSGFNLAVAASGKSIVITSTVSWASNLEGVVNQPQIGDLLHIPSGSAIAGAGNANVGWYTVTASGTATVSATRLSNSSCVNIVRCTTYFYTRHR